MLAVKVLIGAVVAVHALLFVVLYRRYLERALTRPGLASAWATRHDGHASRPGERAARIQAVISAVAVTTVIMMGTFFVLMLLVVIIGAIR